MLTVYNEFKNFCRITANGLEISTYAEIRNSLIARYKQIYGRDIDLSDASADGQWIAEQALIYNNMLQSLKLIYSQLNPNTATGSFLEMICAFSNVYRRPASKSIASITVQFNEETSISSLDVVDGNGTIWSWSSDESESFEPNKDYTFQVTCSEPGPVTAPAGTINKTAMALSYIKSISQPSDAIIGSYKETDASLRARRNLSLAQSSTTINEGLVGSLLALEPIKDVRIYDEGNQTEANDGTTIPSHAVYVIIKVTGSEVNDKAVGNIIYQMMTPGILTTESDDSDPASHHSYAYQVTDSISKTVYWKQATNILPHGSITLKKKDYWSDQTILTIMNELYSYLSNCSIGETPSTFEMLSRLQSVDPLYRGLSTYSIQTVTISNSSDIAKDNAYMPRVIKSTSDVEITVTGSDITVTF